MDMPANLGVQLGVFDLPETIDRNFRNIEDWCHQCGRSYPDLKAATVARILAGDLDDDSMINENADQIFQRGSDPNLIPIIHSLVYSVLAENAYEQGDSARGWSFVADACHLSGVAQSYALQEQIRLAAIKKKADGRKGAAVNDKNDYQPVKKKLVELLREMLPEGGWTDAATAARSVLLKIEEYISETPNRKQINLKKSNLLNTLTNWLTKDLFVSVEFKALLAIKA